MTVLTNLLAAIAFYTCIPVPVASHLDFRRVACAAPWVGVLIGGVLGGLDLGLQALGGLHLTQSVGLVLVWLGLTGGLHLDGVMDTADGLAVTDPQRRLEAMSDSTTGAFGVMGAIAVLLLKVAALSDLETHRVMMLVIAPTLGRWAQQLAIARYPYLKSSGKGAFHKAAIQSWLDLVPGGLLLLVLMGGGGWLSDNSGWDGVALTLAGGAIALGTGAWFNRKLGGHTGDTYGAVVEWTEALFLVSGAIFLG